MSKKIKIYIILLVFILSLFLNFKVIKAYSGEIDPENMIILPKNLSVSNGIATGTIFLSPENPNYQISYQKVDITEEIYQNIINKRNEVNTFIQENNDKLMEEMIGVEDLQDEYERLRDSETAEEEQITEAYNKYMEARATYLENYEQVSSQNEAKKQEFYSLIPDYTNNWINTTNSDDNVKIDFSNYSGTIHFVLWVKVQDQSNTYYDMDIYSSDIKQQQDQSNITINNVSATIKVNQTVQLTATSSTGSNISWTSSDTSVATVTQEGLVTGIKQGTATITAQADGKKAICTVTVVSEQEDEESGDVETNFSEAEYQLKKHEVSKAKVEISNMVINNENTYYMLITNNNTLPDIQSINEDDKISLTYDDTNKILETIDTDKVAEYVELNQDLYISVVEIKDDGSQEIVSYGNKVERYSEPQYNDAFLESFITSDENQIITQFTYSGVNNRKLQIKIGQITNSEILEKIRKNDKTGFEDLMDYAKSNNGIFDEIVEANRNDTYAIEYTAGTGVNNDNNLLNITGLKDDAYYFMYVEVDDEDGKYITQEAVTLAKANTSENNDWSLIFYGSSDFEFEESGNSIFDDTKAPGTLPQTGVSTVIIIVSVIALAGIGAFSYIKYRKNNFK